jgi:hypothetical protein
MIKLIIKSKGLFINIPGLIPFRTPAIVDITKIHINIVISELKKNGIEKYYIISDETINKDIRLKKHKQPQREEIKNNNDDEILKTIKDQQKSILKIETLLQTFLNSDTNIKLFEKKNNVENEFKKPKKKFEEPVEDFIPSIDLDITLKGSTASRKITNKTDLSNTEELKNVTKRRDIKNG